MSVAQIVANPQFRARNAVVYARDDDGTPDRNVYASPGPLHRNVR